MHCFACLVNLDVDSCWLSVIIMSVISIIFGSEMDFVEKRAKCIILCKCFMDILIKWSSGRNHIVIFQINTVNSPKQRVK